MNKKVILALDNLTLEDSINITNQVKDKLLTVKVGLELFNLVSKIVQFWEKIRMIKWLITLFLLKILISNN